jgi:hypothetical protein
MRARIAAARFRIAVQRPSIDLADEFATCVARCLDCPVRDVIGPDLATRLERAGISRALASQAADVFDEEIASRHGGRSSDDAIRSAREIVDALAREFDQA